MLEFCRFTDLVNHSAEYRKESFLESDPLRNAGMSDPPPDGGRSFAFFFYSGIIFRMAKMDPFGEIFFHGRR